MYTVLRETRLPRSPWLARTMKTLWRKVEDGSSWGRDDGVPNSEGFRDLCSECELGQEFVLRKWMEITNSIP
jgi:hypothetical protein